MKNVLSALVAAFLTCATAQGIAEEKEDFSQLIYGPVFPTGHFDFEQDPEFSMIVLELKNMIISLRYDDEDRSIDRLNRWNHFCAVGYVFPVDPNEKEEFPLEKEVIVYWKEEGTLMRWWGDDPEKIKENFYYAKTLLFSRGFSIENAVERKYLDQTILGTGQLVKEDFDNMLADCEKHGKQYIIGPFTPPFEEY
jgi:hypothetical protein